jgi:hypothetical protein
MKTDFSYNKNSLLAIAFCAASLTSFGQDKKPPTTISGEVLDMACYSASAPAAKDINPVLHPALKAVPQWAFLQAMAKCISSLKITTRKTPMRKHKNMQANR